MAVLKNKDNTEFMIDCECGCDDGIRFRIDKNDDGYWWMTYTNGNFYRDQNDSVFKIMRKKMKKIWAIIKNKDFYYSEIWMTKEDFEDFKKFLNKVGDD